MTRSRPDFPLGVELEVLIRREDAERFIDEVRGEEPKLAINLLIEERELEAGLRRGQAVAHALCHRRWHGVHARRS